MHLLSSSQLDAVDLWKVVSIALTGLFGVLGLLTEYKDPDTKRVTAWGYLSLAGIIISAFAGVLAQFVELGRAQESSRKSAAQSLSVARDTSLAVSQIRRILTPIGSSKLIFWFSIPCSRNVTYRVFCRSPWGRVDIISDIKIWPEGKLGDVGLGVSYQPDGPEHIAAQFSGSLKKIPGNTLVDGSSDDGVNPTLLEFFVEIPLKCSNRQDINVKSMYDLISGDTYFWLYAHGLRRLELKKVFWIGGNGDVLESSNSHISAKDIPAEGEQYRIRFKPAEHYFPGGQHIEIGM